MGKVGGFSSNSLEKEGAGSDTENGFFPPKKGSNPGFSGSQESLGIPRIALLGFLGCPVQGLDFPLGAENIP